MLNTNPTLEVIDWGLIDYREALQRQQELVQKISEGTESEKIIFCSHPSIVTLGRGTKPGDVFSWPGDTIEVNRGGRATYHGPSQLVMYPLIFLGEPSNEKFLAKKIPPRDLHQYMRALEESVRLTLKNFDIESSSHVLQKQVGELTADEATGVWIGNKKIAAIGIAIRKWVTSHGVALNLYEDPLAFKGFFPCGFKEDQVVSLELALSKKIERAEIKKKWLKNFTDLVLQETNFPYRSNQNSR